MISQKPHFYFFKLLLSVVYLNFLLMAPFFHLHMEMVSREPLIHSHLTDDTDSHHDESASGDIIDAENGFHLFRLNTVNNVIHPRNFISHLLFNSASANSSFNLIQIPDQKDYEIKEFFTNSLREKYVHSASNVSPPLA